MKKFLSLLCMITCIFGLTACGSEEVLTDYEQQKVAYAERMAAQNIVPLLTVFMDEEEPSFQENTLKEVEYIIGSEYGISVEGNAFIGAMDSFRKAGAEIGAIKEIGEAKATIDDKQIIVNVQITGEKKNAEAEVILSNDMFMVLESAALNPVSTMGDMMVKATLNTLIGMGTVFAVLILISFIISAFALIPKIQAKLAKKKKEEKTIGIDNAVAQIERAEENADETDDLELVAVIAAAIAASEGAASTDGFVVRSIRKVRR